MTAIETIRNLEKRYHVHIDREFFYMPLSGERCEDFKIYSADGCCWDKVIGYRSLIRTLAEDKDALKRIANREETLDDSTIPHLKATKTPHLSPEDFYEMQSAFGTGTTVVNVLTSEKYAL